MPRKRKHEDDDDKLWRHYYHSRGDIYDPEDMFEDLELPPLPEYKESYAVPPLPKPVKEPDPEETSKMEPYDLPPLPPYLEPTTTTTTTTTKEPEEEDTYPNLPPPLPQPIPMPEVQESQPSEKALRIQHQLDNPPKKTWKQTMKDTAKKIEKLTDHINHPHVEKLKQHLPARHKTILNGIKHVNKLAKYLSQEERDIEQEKLDREAATRARNAYAAQAMREMYGGQQYHPAPTPAPKRKPLFPQWREEEYQEKLARERKLKQKQQVQQMQEEEKKKKPEWHPTFPEWTRPIELKKKRETGEDDEEEEDDDVLRFHHEKESSWHGKLWFELKGKRKVSERMAEIVRKGLGNADWSEGYKRVGEYINDEHANVLKYAFDQLSPEEQDKWFREAFDYFQSKPSLKPYLQRLKKAFPKNTRCISCGLHRKYFTICCLKKLKKI